jgi:bifunctional UDP-N-acetylglucosamine pyrophosphorylase/glucosamine-1-phosphate N-acetyltransferase
MTTSLILLAAGQGTRMNSELPKVLQPLGGAPLIAHALSAGRALDPQKIVIVAGHGAEMLRKTVTRLDPEAEIVLQSERLGTAHAVAQARSAVAPGDVVVLYGDTPFIAPETLERLQDARARFDIVVLGFHAADPGRYGRILAEGDTLHAIVEWKDASEAERAITLCNSGVMAAEAATLFDLIDHVGNDNASGEFYLTDVPALARARGLSAGVVICDEAETLGINTRSELAAAEAAFQARKRAEALENGVTMQDAASVWFSFDTVIGRDAILGPNIVFGPGVTVESGARIEAFCHLEGCHISRGATVGPFARLRPGAELAEDVHVGNFVEIKNATLDEGVKVGHLTYLGDAHVGEHSNIGAGTVTCNYDGVMKHRTEIGAHVFIGSDTMLVAPVTIGTRAMTASGSVITQNVPADALAIARAAQTNKPGLATRLMNRLRAIKAGTS